MEQETMESHSEGQVFSEYDEVINKLFIKTVVDGIEIQDENRELPNVTNPREFMEIEYSSNMRNPLEQSSSESNPTEDELIETVRRTKEDISKEKQGARIIEAKYGVFSSEIIKIREWAIKYKIPHNHLDSLLAILRKRLIPYLPGSAKTFLDHYPSSTASTSTNTFREKDATQLEPSSSEQFLNNVTESKSDNTEKLQFVQVNTNLFKDLIKSNLALQKETREMLETVKSLSQNLQGGKSVVSADLSLTKYNIQIPLKSVKELQDFERKLTENEKCLYDTIAAMKLLLSNEKVQRSVVDILKKFLTREVAMQFTATKKMPKKYVLEKECPSFFTCIKEAVVSSHTNATEKKIIVAVGTALTNSGDWDNNRMMRRKERENATPRSSENMTMESIPETRAHSSRQLNLNSVRDYDTSSDESSE